MSIHDCTDPIPWRHPRRRDYVSALDWLADTCRADPDLRSVTTPTTLPDVVRMLAAHGWVDESAMAALTAALRRCCHAGCADSNWVVSVRPKACRAGRTTYALHLQLRE